VVSNVISRLANVATKLNNIITIRKYRNFYEGHHFILMTMEVHITLRRDMNHFIRECGCLFHNKRSKGHLFLSFCIQFFKQHVSIALQHVLASIIERKIALVGDACSRPSTTIRSNNLHVGHIREDMGEIASYHKRD
jgi:hypothetical protein